MSMSRNVRNTVRPAVALLLSLLFIGGCSRQPASTDASGLSGTVKISGAWALYPLAVAWAEEFQKLHPQVRIDVAAGGAGKGIADVLAGLVDIGMVSRDITPEENAKGCLGVPVAIDAVMCIVNARNPVLTTLQQRGMTREQCQSVWLSRDKLTWAVVSGTSNTQPVSVYTRSDAAGAPETWARYLGKRQEDLKGTAVYGDPGVVEAVRQDPNGIGYCNLNYAYDATSGAAIDGIAVLSLDANTNGVMDAGEAIGTKRQAMAAIAAGTYPSPPARPLFFAGKGQLKGVAAAFVAWTLADGQRMVEPTGYIVLNSNQLAAARMQVGQ